MRFEGTSGYVATDDLKIAVNAAIALERPLLVKGEPGTGKTVLALEIAKALGAPLIEWHIKSTTKALQGLYEYDAVTRLRDSQLGDSRVKDIRNYIKRGKLWEAFIADERPVLLIDEVDRADEEFEAFLLELLADFQITIPELGTIVATSIPRVVLAPIFIMLFGLGLASKVALAFVMVFFVVFHNAFQGVREADRSMIANARILGASDWQLTRSVIVPSAMSWIFASLHVSFGFAIIGAIVGEFVGSRYGIGLLINVAKGSFDAAGMYAAIVIVMELRRR